MLLPTVKNIWNKINTTVKNIWNKIKEEPLLSYSYLPTPPRRSGLSQASYYLNVSQCTFQSLAYLFQKNETLKFLGISMGGILIALQALMSYKRAKAMEETANAQVKATEQAKANQHTEQGSPEKRY